MKGVTRQSVQLTQSVEPTMARVNSVPVAIGRTYRRLGLPLLRLAAVVTVLWFLWRHVGAAAFEDGLRAVTWPAVVAAVTLTALTMVCWCGAERRVP